MVKNEMVNSASHQTCMVKVNGSQFSNENQHDKPEQLSKLLQSIQNYTIIIPFSFSLGANKTAKLQNFVIESNSSFYRTIVSPRNAISSSATCKTLGNGLTQSSSIKCAHIFGG